MYVLIHVFLISALVCEWQLHVPAALPSEKGPTVPIEHKAGCPKVNLDDMEQIKVLTISGLELGPSVAQHVPVVLNL
jgi:hypothetical protein